MCPPFSVNMTSVPNAIIAAIACWPAWPSIRWVIIDPVFQRRSGVGLLVVVTRQPAEITFGRDEADVLDRHRPAEVQHADLGEHRQPVDEPMEDDRSRLQHLVEIADGLPGLGVLHQRQARYRDLVLRRGDLRVSEAVDLARVPTREAP